MCFRQTEEGFEYCFATQYGLAVASYSSVPDEDDEFWSFKSFQITVRDDPENYALVQALVMVQQDVLVMTRDCQVKAYTGGSSLETVGV